MIRRRTAFIAGNHTAWRSHITIASVTGIRFIRTITTSPTTSRTSAATSAAVGARTRTIAVAINSVALRSRAAGVWKIVIHTINAAFCRISRASFSCAILPWAAAVIIVGAGIRTRTSIPAVPRSAITARIFSITASSHPARIACSCTHI